MKIRNIILLSVIAVGMSSCSTIRRSTVSTADVFTTVVQYPTVADLDVMNKVEKTMTWTFNPLKLENLAQNKTNLQADLLREVNADVLLEPQFIYTKVPYGERTLTVTGYPAKFKNFRKATPEDMDALGVVYETPKDQKVYEVSDRCEKKKLGILRFLGL